MNLQAFLPYRLAVVADAVSRALDDDGSLLLSNDSDYGTEGAVTQFWRVSPGAPIDR